MVHATFFAICLFQSKLEIFQPIKTLPIPNKTLKDCASNWLLPINE